LGRYFNSWTETHVVSRHRTPVDGIEDLDSHDSVEDSEEEEDDEEQDHEATGDRKVSVQTLAT
jgi:hypothetical protein